MKRIVAKTENIWAPIGSARPVYSILILYCLLHFIVRLALSPNYGAGESGQMLFNQAFQWVYGPGNPPLYNWLAWLVAVLSGNSRAAFFLLKYAFMAAGLAGYFSAARILIGDAKLAALSAFGLLSTFALGYVLHVNSAHVALSAAMSGLFLWTLARAVTIGKTRDYLLLGIAAGFGMLSQFVFAVLPAALALAVALTPPLRRRVRMLPMAGALSAAFAIVIVYAWWSSSLSALGTAGISGGPSFNPHMWPGDTLRIVEAVLEFCLPLIPAFPLIYRKAFRLPAPRAAGETDRAWIGALAIAMLSACAAIWIGSLVAGTAEFDRRWIYLALMPLPIWLFLRAKLAGADDRSNAIFLVFAAVCAIGVFIALPAVYFMGASHCSRCREYWPMRTYAQSLQRAGFYRGTIVASAADLGGNIRYVMPDSRVVVPGYAPSVFGGPQGGQCLIVWRGKAAMPANEERYVRDVLRAPIGPDAIRGNVFAALLTDSRRFDTLNYVLLPSGSGLCN